MLIKVAELTGIALNWAVAKCEDKVEAGVYGMPEVVEGELHLRYCDTVLSNRFAPAFCWAQGGLIIERENIPTHTVESYAGRLWKSEKSYGATPLIAAMRCYCRSKLGDVVDIPEELCQQQNS